MRRATPLDPICFDQLGISIHALREEGDYWLSSNVQFRKVFLSTPSVRRATSQLCIGVALIGISIHALREEGDPTDTFERRMGNCISIHALREEGDKASGFRYRPPRYFYPRPP